MYINDIIDVFSEVKECDYKGNHYSVRDNGAIYRHALIPGMPRKLDEIWTFGKKDNRSGYMMYGGERVHIIVARAFLGERDSKQYVVDHIDTNRCNNRVENLRWFTKLENALNNPVTRKKITYLCGGDIQKFLDDPSCLRDLTGNNQNVMWMRTVTSEEARNAYERIMHWVNKSNSRSSSGDVLGEWMYSSYVPFEEDENIKAFLNTYHKNEKNTGVEFLEDECNVVYVDLTESFTANAKQKRWHTPTYFTLCPNEMDLNKYYSNLDLGKEFCYNNLWRSKIANFAKSVNGDGILVVCDNGENSLKRWALIRITLENDFYVQETLGTYFKYEGVMKYFTLEQGKMWEGEDEIDDFC